MALEAIKGQQPIHELAKEFDVHPNQIGQWKKQLLESASQLFDRGQDADTAAQAAELDRAYRQVGRLHVEVDFLKKKSVTWTDGCG